MTFRDFPVLIAAVLLSSAFAAPVVAATLIYNCTMDVKGRKIIANQVIVAHEVETDKVVVADGIIRRHNDAPIAGRVVEQSDTRVTFGWEIATSNNRQQSVRLSYRMTYFKANGQAIIDMAALQYTNRDQARGACTVVQN